MRLSRQPPERLFFTLAGLWLLAITLIGFGPTFFLQPFRDPGEAYSLQPSLIVHGVLYAGWMALFLVQASLISLRRARWHRMLGMAAIVLLLAMIPSGFHTVLANVSSGAKSVDEAGFNLTEFALAFAFAFAGIALRGSPFAHKRLMFAATTVFAVAAADRVAGLVGLDDVRLFRKLLAAAPLMALVLFDIAVTRKPPVLSLSLLALVWLVIYALASDLLFMQPAGEAVIRALTPVFVW